MTYEQANAGFKAEHELQHRLHGYQLTATGCLALGCGRRWGRWLGRVAA